MLMVAWHGHGHGVPTNRSAVRMALLVSGNVLFSRYSVPQVFFSDFGGCRLTPGKSDPKVYRQTVRYLHLDKYLLRSYLQFEHFGSLVVASSSVVAIK